MPNIQLPLPCSLPVNATSSFSRRHLRTRLLPALVVCVVVLAYLRFIAWSASPSPSAPVPLTIADSNSSSDPHPNVVDHPISSKAPPRILIVSALFLLSRSKHTHEEYRSWLANFVGPHGVQSDMYFYTTPELAPLVSALHASTTQRLIINTTYTSPFSVPPLSPYTAKYHEMHAWDRERARHNPELYAVWNAKPWLLEHALSSLSHSNESQGEYDYAFWVDAGSFRAPHPFRGWPDPRRVEEVFSAGGGGGVEDGKDKVLIPLCNVPGLREYGWSFEKGPVDMDFSEGSFFGSTPSGISWFSKTFYETHDWYINTTPSPPPFPLSLLTTNPPFHFVGKDQTLINTILFQYPDRFIGVYAPSRVDLLPPPSTHPTSRPYILTLSSIFTRLSRLLSRHKSSCGDWFFYQWFLASPFQREEARKAGWIGCGSGEVGSGELVHVGRLLRGLFGSRWVEMMAGGG